MRAFSFLGDLAAATALTLHLQQSGNTPLLVVVGLVAATIPAIVLAPLSGRVSDSISPKKLLFLVSIAQSVVVLVMSLTTSVPVLIVGILLVSSGLAFTNPVYSSMPRRIVVQDQVAHASALSQTTVQIAMLAAPAAGGFMFAAGGLKLSLLLTCSCYAIIAVVSLFVALPGSTVRSSPQDSSSSTLQYSVFRDRQLLAVISSSAAVVAFVSANSVLAVYLIRDTFSASASEFGIIETMWILGVVLGGVFIVRIAQHNVTRALLISFTLMGIALTLEGLSPWLWALFFLNVVGGLGNGGMATSLHVYINTKVAETHVGRAFATLGAASNAAPFVGFLLGGVLLTFLTPRAAFVVIGIGSLFVAGIAAVVLVNVVVMKGVSSDARKVEEPANRSK